MRIEWGYDITGEELEDNGYPLDESKEMAAKALSNLKMVNDGCACVVSKSHEEIKWYRRGMLWGELLSEQQINIFILKGREMSERDIADKLNISRIHVRTQWKRAQEKGTKVISIESK